MKHVKKAGYNFHPKKYLRGWLHKQASWQIHASRPQYIPYASFNNITVPNEVLQADVLYTPYDKIGKITYLFCLTVVDVASRFKWAEPIGTTLDTNDDYFSLEGILTSAVIAECFEKIFNNPKCPLMWPKLLITDKGSEFKGDCERLFLKNGIKIQKANSK
ncbi:3025_t:CDS:1, partial [Entrophospora sp. SA101]